MYCDIDNNRRAAIMDLTPDELETIRRALIAYRTGMIQCRRPIGFRTDTEPQKQYDRAGEILRHIETLE